jgi:hypothetical protein
MRSLSRWLLAAAVFLLVLAPAAGAANPPEGTWAWAAPYTSAETNQGFQLLARGPAGSVYVVGDTTNWYWVVSRVDTATGAEVWSQRTQLPTMDLKPAAIASDRQRNLVVAGRCTAATQDFYTVKYDPSGTVLWKRPWSGPANLDDYVMSVAIGKAGDVYVAGRIGKPAGYDDAVLLKYDAGGHLKWKYVISTAGFDVFKEVVCDAYGNAYLIGQRGGDMDAGQMVTLKVDRDGHRLWLRSIAGLGVLYDGDHIRLKGANVYVTGELYKGDMWPIAAKYSTAGKRAWAVAASHSLSSIDDMAVDPLGRIVMVGSSYGSLYGGGPLVYSAYLWVWSADGKGVDASTSFSFDNGSGQWYPGRLNRVVVDSTGTMYCAGGWDTNGAGTEANAVLARVPPPETPGWNGVDKVWRYDGPASGVDEFHGLLRVSDSEIFAAGMRHTVSGYRGIAERPTLP